MRLDRAYVVAILLLAAGFPAQAQSAAFLDQPITVQYNVKVPMRDGVKLSADIYRPQDDAQHPSVFELTPYGKNSDRMVERAWNWVRRGYAFVRVDVRGRFDSEGDFMPLRNDGRDGSDVMDWIAAQRWSDRRIATIGGSYTGMNQRLIALQRNPHHVVMTPYVAPFDDWSDLTRYNGVPKLDLNYTWHMLMDGRVMQSMAHWRWADVMNQLPLVELDRRVGRNSKAWQQAMTHDVLDDFWRPLQLSDRHDTVGIPSFNVTGWYEGQLRGTLNGYESSVRATGRSADHVLIIGPWLHRENDPNARTIGERNSGPFGIIDLDRLLNAWVDHHMLGKPRPSLPNVLYFLPVKNEWRSAEAWPPPSGKVTSFYLDSGGKANSRHGNGTLGTLGPGRGPADEFVYDPANPVRSVSSRTAGARGGLPQGSVDNRAVEDRPDVLVYTSEPLAEAMEVTGRVAAKIYFSTDVPDTDITVKLLDVAPDGRALNISEGIARARYRRSYSETEMLEPGRIYAMDVELFPTSNFFEIGHRIRVEVSSSDFPNFGRNLNTGRNNETSAEMRVAHTRIHHSTDSPSSIALPVVPIATPKWTPPLP